MSLFEWLSSSSSSSSSTTTTTTTTFYVTDMFSDSNETK
jgi:hypothetical protein